jgi:hypothetical protein
MSGSSGHATGTLRWNHLFNNKLSQILLCIHNYSFGVYDEHIVTAEDKNYYAEYYSGIRILLLNSIWIFANPKHRIKVGAISILYRFSPHAFVEIDKQRAPIIVKRCIPSDSNQVCMLKTPQPLDVLK